MTAAPGGTVVVDSTRCTGQGRCFTQFPGLFDCDDDGFATVVVERVEAGSELARDAADAVDVCPESAIRIEP